MIIEDEKLSPWEATIHGSSLTLKAGLDVTELKELPPEFFIVPQPEVKRKLKEQDFWD